MKLIVPIIRCLYTGEKYQSCGVAIAVRISQCNMVASESVGIAEKNEDSSSSENSCTNPQSFNSSGSHVNHFWFT